MQQRGHEYYESHDHVSSPCSKLGSAADPPHPARHAGEARRVLGKPGLHPDALSGMDNMTGNARVWGGYEPSPGRWELRMYMKPRAR